MDKLGPMGRPADDCGLVLAAIAGADPADPTSVDRHFDWPDPNPPASSFRLLTLKGAVDHVQDRVRQNFEKSLKVFGEFCEIDETELPDLPYEDVAGTFISCEMAAAFEGLVTSGDVWEMTAPEDRWGAHAAMVIPARDYINAMRIRPKIQAALDAILATCDAIVTPTRSTVAYPIDKSFREYTRGFRSSRIGGAGNAAGVPAVCVPNGFDKDKLPTGVQLVGRAFEESRLIAIANRYQHETDWHTKRPDV